MAKVTFNPNQPIQSLSGTFGCNTFRTLNGRTYLNQRPEPVLPKNPTPQQRAAFRRQTIIDHCVAFLQQQIRDIPLAITSRPLIRSRVVRLYNRISPSVKTPAKLRRAILSEYRRKFCKTSSNRYRTIPEPFPNHSQP